MATAIKTSHNKIMNCVEAFDPRIKQVERLTAAKPDMVRAVNTKLSVSSEKVKEVDGRMSQNRENIMELENSVKLLGEKKDEPPASYSGS